eukprot:586636-Amphidinium_carterae.1
MSTTDNAVAGANVDFVTIALMLVKMEVALLWEDVKSQRVVVWLIRRTCSCGPLCVLMQSWKRVAISAIIAVCSNLG